VSRDPRHPTLEISEAGGGVGDLHGANRSVGPHLETLDVLRRRSQGRWEWYTPEAGESLRRRQYRYESRRPHVPA
jgi:hypothetical protein